MDFQQHAFQRLGFLLQHGLRDRDRLFKRVLEGTDIDFQRLLGHLTATDFPFTLDELQPYDVVILSDLGANTLLLPPQVWLHRKSAPNRLRLLAECVQGGGGFAMRGGYYSFAGIYGGAEYYRTPLEEICQ